MVFVRLNSAQRAKTYSHIKNLLLKRSLDERYSVV